MKTYSHKVHKDDLASKSTKVIKFKGPKVTKLMADSTRLDKPLRPL